MPLAVAYTPAPEGEREIRGRIEWNTKAGKLIRADRTKNGDAWETVRVDISTIDQPDGSVVRPSMLMDFASGQNGWVRFSPYDEVMVGIFDTLPPRPAEYRDAAGQPVLDKYGKPVRHDQTVRVPVYAPKVFGAENPIWELSMKGGNAITALGNFLARVEVAPEFLAGKLPLVRWDKARIVDSKGNSVPEWTILSWHDRPAAFPARAAPAVAPAAPSPAAPAPRAPAMAGAAAGPIDDEIPFAPEWR